MSKWHYRLHYLPSNTNATIRNGSTLDETIQNLLHRGFRPSQLTITVVLENEPDKEVLDR